MCVTYDMNNSVTLKMVLHASHTYASLNLCRLIQSVVVFQRLTLKIAKNESLCIYNSTPPDYCEYGPVLSLGEGLSWKFSGKTIRVGLDFF